MTLFVITHEKAGRFVHARIEIKDRDGTPRRLVGKITRMLPHEFEDFRRLLRAGVLASAALRRCSDVMIVEEQPCRPDR